MQAKISFVQELDVAEGESVPEGSTILGDGRVVRATLVPVEVGDDGLIRVVEDE